MFDPELEVAFRNVAKRTLRDSNGQPPSEKRMEQMLSKFRRLIESGKPGDFSYVEAIGDSWKLVDDNVKTKRE